MSETVEEMLDAALSRHLGTPDDSGECLELGAFRIAETPSFGRDVADSFAELAGLPRWEEFFRLASMQGVTKPLKPAPEYIEALARSIESDPAKRPYALALVAERQNTAYQTKFLEYEKERKESERIAQNFGASEAGYIRFLSADNSEIFQFFLNARPSSPLPKMIASGTPTLPAAQARERARQLRLYSTIT
ncbi:hypothetical protein [Magnetospirillum sp. LM-5]|uniref:hypothetical protein n=1 Tax=Magnetospirillum sp. LM-5 TaxID=2681466 RepID=UPI0020C5115F|nr:hypothetical protein [Magnetospirillum sp. LM-5]